MDPLELQIQTAQETLQNLEADIHEKQDTMNALSNQIEEIKPINLMLYQQLKANIPEVWIVKEANEAPQKILRIALNLNKATKKVLRRLRTGIFDGDGLDGETSCHLSIYVNGTNEDNPYEFKIGGGSQNLIINIVDDELTSKFTTGRYWTRFCRFARGAIVVFACCTFGSLTGGLIGFLTQGQTGAVIGGVLGLGTGLGKVPSATLVGAALGYLGRNLMK